MGIKRYILKILISNDFLNSFEHIYQKVKQAITIFMFELHKFLKLFIDQVIVYVIGNLILKIFT